MGGQRGSDGSAVDQEILTSGFAQSAVGLAITDVGPAGAVSERVVRVNAALVDLLGYTSDELMADGGRLLGLDQFDGKPGKRVVLRGRDFEATEVPLVHRDGRELWVAVRADTIRDADGVPRNRAIRIEDISQSHADQRALRYLADHDALTGLVNRRRFSEEVQRAIDAADRFGDAYELLFLDLDHFKMLNDARGHSVGDAYLTQFANLLREMTRSTDVVARLSGDEFAVLLARTGIDDALAIAEKIRTSAHALELPNPHGDPIAMTVSIGIATIEPGSDSSAADLLVNADLAMYEAKLSGRDAVRRFEEQEAQREHMAARLAWATQIRRALEDDLFVLFAQPIVAADTREPEWYELLLRLPDAEGELLLPSAFLYAASRFGLAARVDQTVLEKALAYLQRMPDDGPGLAVNVSGSLITDPANAQRFADDLARSGVDPSRLMLEIIETTFVDTTTNADAFIDIVRATGCSFALDDFGAGYSSFHHLKSVTVDAVKIDGEFVRQSVDSETDRLFVRTMTDLIHGLGMRVIAEYVTDEPTAALMAELQVDYLQGQAIGMPAPADEILPLRDAS